MDLLGARRNLEVAGCSSVCKSGPKHKLYGDKREKITYGFGRNFEEHF